MSDTSLDTPIEVIEVIEVESETGEAELGDRATGYHAELGDPVPTTAIRPRSGERVLLRIGDAYLRVAATSILQNNGVDILDYDDGESYLITDNMRMLGPRTILIVEETSGASQAAITALLNRQVSAVVSRSDPHHLALVLAALAQGLTSVPDRIIDVACNGPSLRERQLQVLSLVASGLPNGRIAQRLHVSEATVKREVSGLLRVFNCNTRLELAMKSTEVGYAIKRAAAALQSD